MSGSTSGLPYGVFSRNGYTWFITANEPLSYEPAGSSAVTCSVVPMVSVPPDASVLPPPPAVQPASARAATEAPATAMRARFRFVDADVISVYLFLSGLKRAARRTRRVVVSPRPSTRRCGCCMVVRSHGGMFMDLQPSHATDGRAGAGTATDAAQSPWSARRSVSSSTRARCSVAYVVDVGAVGALQPPEQLGLLAQQLAIDERAHHARDVGGQLGLAALRHGGDGELVHDAGERRGHLGDDAVDPDGRIGRGEHRGDAVAHDRERRVAEAGCRSRAGAGRRRSRRGTAAWPAARRARGASTGRSAGR